MPNQNLAALIDRFVATVDSHLDAGMTAEVIHYAAERARRFPPHMDPQSHEVIRYWQGRLEEREKIQTQRDDSLREIQTTGPDLARELALQGEDSIPLRRVLDRLLERSLTVKLPPPSTWFPADCLEGWREVKAQLGDIADRSRTQNQPEEATDSLASVPSVVADRGAALEWSRPEYVKTWEKVFNCSRGTMTKRLQEQDPPNRKFGKRYMVAIAYIPLPAREKYRNTTSR